MTKKIYRLDFADTLDFTKYRLDIKKDDPSGGSTTLIKGQGSPVEISAPNADGNKFTPIRGREMNMNLLIDNSITDFKSEFKNITDREWQAELKQFNEGIYVGTCQIDTLDLDATSTPPFGTIKVLTTGGFLDPPTCEVHLTVNIPTAGSRTLTLFVGPEY